MAQGASFRAGTFDPTLLLSQIVALQCSYYICLSLLVGLLAVLTGAPFTLHHLLSFTEIDSSTALGWSLFLAFLVTAFISCFLLLVIVERTRLCIDFACTLHLLHLLLVTFYSNSIPNSFLWWMLLIVSTVITALGGERLCIWRELEPIALSGGTATAKRATEERADRPGRRRRGEPDVDDIELEKLNSAGSDMH